MSPIKNLWIPTLIWFKIEVWNIISMSFLWTFNALPSFPYFSVVLYKIQLGQENENTFKISQKSIYISKPIKQ